MPNFITKFNMLRSLLNTNLVFDSDSVFGKLSFLSSFVMMIGKKNN